MSSQDNFIKIVEDSDIISNIDHTRIIDVHDADTNTLIQTPASDLKMAFLEPLEEPSVNVVYQVVYPGDLSLEPIVAPQKVKSRAGRPKKQKVEQAVKVVAKTRSGREVKFPKHMQNDFKRIEVGEDNSPSDTAESDIKVTDFVTYATNKIDECTDEPPPPLIQLEDINQKKRRIAAQYRCPKCKKAYLGRRKILEHLRKNPSHGPMQQSEDNHFELWNYLVSITQKCNYTERGPKFCQEISNLLHNLVLLTNALFKKIGSAANEVEIDKVLGNAIGLSPGTYYFDDNNLYKDVTVLKLMGNTDFLSSIRLKQDEHNSQQENNCDCKKKENHADELKSKSVEISSEANESIANKINDIKLAPEKTEKKSDIFVTNEVNLTTYLGDIDIKIDTDQNDSKSGEDKNVRDSNNFPPTLVYEEASFDARSSPRQTNKFNNIDEKLRPNPRIKIQQNIVICPPNPKYKCSTENKSTVNPELLSDNSILIPMTNLQTDDELMLPDSSETGNILDNSTSSDEVMNVDQFVNESFRRITGTDSLNLDMTSLDLFHLN